MPHPETVSPQGEHPHGEHPHGEHPHREHPHAEHPKGLHLNLLGQRYSAAWAEHCVRLTERQQTIRTYLIAAGVIFGFYFAKRGQSPQTSGEAYFLSLGISALTTYASILIWAHNRVIGRLLHFLCSCECAAHAAIEDIDKSLVAKRSLFYFWQALPEGPKTEPKIANFHYQQRLVHGLCHALIFTPTAGAALYLTTDTICEAWTVSLGIIVALSIVIPLALLFRREVFTPEQ